MKTNYIIIFVTTANKAEGEKIARLLLKEKLIACANIINPITSLFRWAGNIDKAEECLVVMKSRIELFSELSEKIKWLHGYEIPEILAIPIIAGSQDYFKWINEVLK
jgi:periplasmic divalent cation tolerance protein